MRGTRGEFWAHVAGLHTGTAEIRRRGRQRGVFLDLTVAGARALLGIPAAGLAGALVEAADVDRATP